MLPRLIRCTLLTVALATAAPLSAQAVGSDAAGRHTLNLTSADIGVLIQTVSEITGRNFIVDPAVEGRVTVISGQPQGPEEIWRTFESVLRVHGYAVVPSGSMWKVLPEAAALRDAGAGIAAVGVDRPDAMVTRVIEIGQVPAAELAALLRPLVSPSAQLAAQGNTLVVTDRAGNVERIAQLVRRIDTVSDNEVEVIPLRHANASEMARTLTQLEPQAQGLALAGSGRMIADSRTNSMLVSGDRAARLRLRTLVAHLDTPLSDGDATQVVYLRYADGAMLLPVLEGIANTLTGTASDDEGARSATIHHHAETNALVITAVPSVYRELAAVVRSLDVRRAQVMVEAVIAEVSDELADELGVQWQATDIRDDGAGGLTRGVIGGTNLPGSGRGIIGFDPTQGVGPGLNLGFLERVLTLPGSDQPIFQLGILVKALRGDGRANVLSQPTLVMLDHQEAEFKVGQEVPFITGQFTNTGARRHPAAEPVPDHRAPRRRPDAARDPARERGRQRAAGDLPGNLQPVADPACRRCRPDHHEARDPHLGAGARWRPAGARRPEFGGRQRADPGRAGPEPHPRHRCAVPQPPDLALAAQPDDLHAPGDPARRHQRGGGVEREVQLPALGAVADARALRGPGPRRRPASAAGRSAGPVPQPAAASAGAGRGAAR